MTSKKNKHFLVRNTTTKRVDWWTSQIMFYYNIKYSITNISNRIWCTLSKINPDESPSEARRQEPKNCSLFKKNRINIWLNRIQSKKSLDQSKTASRDDTLTTIKTESPTVLQKYMEHVDKNNDTSKIYRGLKRLSGKPKEPPEANLTTDGEENLLVALSQRNCRGLA